MKTTYHGLRYTGFFGELDPGVFDKSLRSLFDKCEQFFSIKSTPMEESIVKVDWALGTDTQRIEPENDSEKTSPMFCLQFASVQ